MAQSPPPPPLAPEYIPALLGALKASQLLPACLAPAVVPALVARYVVAPWIPRRRILDAVSPSTKPPPGSSRAPSGRTAKARRPTSTAAWAPPTPPLKEMRLAPWSPTMVASRIVSTAMTSLSTSVLAKLCAEGDAAMGSKVVALSASLPNVRRIVADKHGLPDTLGPVLRAWGAIEEVVVTTDSCTRAIDMLPAALVSLNVSSVTPLKNLFAPAKGNRGGPVPRWCTPTDAFRFSGLSSLRLPMATRADLAGLVSLRSLRLERPFEDHDGVLRLLGGAPAVADDETASPEDESPRETPPLLADSLPFVEYLTALCIAFRGTSKPLTLPVLPRLQRLGLGVTEAVPRPRIAVVLRAYPHLTWISVSSDWRGFAASYDPAPSPTLLAPPPPALLHKIFHCDFARTNEWQEVLDHVDTRPGMAAPVIDVDSYRMLKKYSEGDTRRRLEAPSPEAAKPTLRFYTAHKTNIFEPWLKDKTDTVLR